MLGHDGNMRALQWVLYMERVDEVNKLLPEGDRFNVLWWYAGKYRRFESEYRRLFPNGKARNREFRLLIIFAAALIVMAVDIALPFR
jgi:hypothetical protein